MTSGFEKRRDFARWAQPERAKLTVSGTVCDCTVLDYSAGGARLVTPEVLEPGITVTLELPGLPPLRGTVVHSSSAATGLHWIDAPQYLFR